MRRVIVLGCVVGALVVAAPAGAANLLVNPGAEAGAYSIQGWDAVTIPGWRVIAGLPTVVRRGTHGFPSAGGRGQLFAGGAGGVARLTQVVSLRTPSGGLQPAGTTYRLSARLGGNRRSAAEVSVTFLSSSGRAVGLRSIGPVRGRGLALLRVIGPVP